MVIKPSQNILKHKENLYILCKNIKRNQNLAISVLIDNIPWQYLSGTSDKLVAMETAINKHYLLDKFINSNRMSYASWCPWQQLSE